MFGVIYERTFHTFDSDEQPDGTETVRIIETFEKKEDLEKWILDTPLTVAQYSIIECTKLQMRISLVS